MGAFDVSLPEDRQRVIDELEQAYEVLAYRLWFYRESRIVPRPHVWENLLEAVLNLGHAIHALRPETAEMSRNASGNKETLPNSRIDRDGPVECHGFDH